VPPTLQGAQIHPTYVLLRAEAGNCSNRKPNPVTHLQAFDPIAVLGAFFFQSRQFTVQLPPLFIFHTRHAQHAPYPFIAHLVPHEHGEQLFEIQVIGLLPPSLARHFDARRVHHQDFDPNARQITMRPKAVSPNLITAPNRSFLWELEAFLGQADLSLQCFQVSGIDRLFSWLLTKANGIGSGHR